MIGVYKILHIPTGKYYIGSSSNISRRMAEHRYKLSHNGKFDCGWIVTDTDIANYEFSVECECTLDELHYRETELIKSADPVLCVNIKADDQKTNRTPNHMCGKHWYNNGTECMCFYEGSEPEGWVRGRITGIAGFDLNDHRNNVNGTPAHEKHLDKLHGGVSEYIETDDMDIQILSNNEFVPMLGILRNSAGASNPLCEVRYRYKGKVTRVLNVTTDHPLVTKRGRVKVEDLQVGDLLIDSVDGDEYPVTEIEPISHRSPTYDVETDNDVFDLDGILSHNCRTRSIGNVNGESVTTGKGNLWFTTINLPAIAVRATKTANPIESFWKELDEKMAMCRECMEERYKTIKNRTYANLYFPMKNGLYMGSDKNAPVTTTIEKAIKNGSNAIGYIGIYEVCLTLLGKVFGVDEEATKFGYEIVKHIREYTDAVQKETHMNWTTFATPAENVCGRFAQIDAKRFGSDDKLNVPGDQIWGKGYYTNSHMMPFDVKTTLAHKLEVEAPFHELTNGGHIFYYKIDGDPSKNVDAVKAAVRAMYDAGIGYGTITFSQDTCRECGYRGIIDNECPHCHCKDNGENVLRIRRITGYLVGRSSQSIEESWGDGKLAELKHRVNI